MVQFTVVADDGSPVEAVAKLSLRHGKPLLGKTDEQGYLRFRSGTSGVDAKDVRQLAVEPMQPGYRCVLLGTEVCEDCRVVLPRLPSPTSPWWLRVLGDVGKPGHGEGIRVGVVDGSRSRLDDLDVSSVAMPFVKQTLLSEARSHASAVCALLCAVAPSATVLHVDVSRGTRKPQIAGTTSAIYGFLAEHPVDILSLSLGSPVHQGLADAIRLANEEGVVTVVAGGNDAASHPAFPASMPECVAVGALGQVRGAARPSLAAWYESRSNHRGAKDCLDGSSVELYHWPESNLNVDYVAPGVVEVGGFDFAGTSFAAPLVAGVIAAMLTRKELDAVTKGERREYVLGELQSISEKIAGLPASVVGAGLPVV